MSRLTIRTLKARLTSPMAMAIASLTVGTLGACGGGSSDYGTFTLSGDTIAYTPDLGKTGTSDSATLRISDGKGGYKDVTVSTSGIDTIGPVLSQSSVTNTAGSYALVMSANEAINTYAQVTKYENPTGSGSFSSTLPSGVFASLSTGFTSSSSGARSITYTLTKPTGTPLTFRADFTVTDSLGNSATASTGNFTVN